MNKNQYDIKDPSLAETGRERIKWAARELPVSADLPDVWIASLVVCLYSVAFAAVAFFVFQRCDLRSSDR